MPTKENKEPTFWELREAIKAAPSNWLPGLMKELLEKCDRDGCYYPAALSVYVKNHTRQEAATLGHNE